MEEKAASAYDLAALKYWGPSTHINFPVYLLLDVKFFFSFCNSFCSSKTSYEINLQNFLSKEVSSPP